MFNRELFFIFVILIHKPCTFYTSLPVFLRIMKFDNQFIVKFKIPMVSARVCVCSKTLSPGGSKLGDRTHVPPPFRHKFLSNSCSFRPLLRGWQIIRPCRGIPSGSTTEFNSKSSEEVGGRLWPLTVVKIVREKAGLKSYPDTRFHSAPPHFDFGSTTQEINHYRGYWWSMNGFIKVKIS